MDGKLLHYDIKQRLGSGGMGEVYLAEDLKLGRQVALKRLPADGAWDPDRLREEARTLAALSHPNIVTLYAVEEDRGEWFLVMERVDGESLTEAIPKYGMPVDRLVDLGIALADAAAAAHRKGILHRDLKPGNVMIDREGHLKVLDFGLSRPLPPEKKEDKEQTATVTEVSKVPGTVPYMAPEILRGRGGDHRTDIFSIGVMLYEMACGRRPFDGETSVEVLVAILKDPPRPLGDLRRGLPKGLVTVIERCLAKDADDRYADAAELALDLRRVKAGLEPSSLEVPLRELLARRLGPRARKRALVALAVIALVAALGFFWSRSSEKSAEPERHLVAVLPFENLGPAEDRYFALGMTEEITARLASVGRLGVIARSSTESFEDSGKSPAEIGRELGADLVLDGTVRWNTPRDGERRVRVTPQLIRTSDGTQVWSEAYERVLEDIFSVQTEIATQVIDQMNIRLFPSEKRALETRPTRNMEAYRAYLQGQEASGFSNDLESQQEAVRLLTRAVELDPDFVEGWAQLAWTHALMYHFGLDRTDDRRRAAEQAIDRALGLDPSSPEARLARANVLYWTRRDYAAALKELALARRRAPNDHRMIEAEGFILRRLGRPEEALAKIQEASRLDPLDPALKREIAGTLFLLRRFRESLPYFDQSIRLSDNPLHAYVYKARTYWALGRLGEARRTLDAMPDSDAPLAVWFETWQSIYERDWTAALDRVDDAEAPVLQWTSLARPFHLLEAQILDWAGRGDEAGPKYERALAEVDALLEQNPEDPRLMISRALALAGLDRREEALAPARRAVEQTPLEVDAVSGAEFLLQLAEVLAAAGERQAAVEELELLLSVPSELSVELLRLDPRWDPLRDLPAFRALSRDRREDS